MQSCVRKLAFCLGSIQWGRLERNAWQEEEVSQCIPRAKGRGMGQRSPSLTTALSQLKHRRRFNAKSSSSSGLDYELNLQVAEHCLACQVPPTDGKFLLLDN